MYHDIKIDQLNCNQTEATAVNEGELMGVTIQKGDFRFQIMALFIFYMYSRNKIVVVHKPEHLWHICIMSTKEYGNLPNKHNHTDHRGIDYLGN